MGNYLNCGTSSKTKRANQLDHTTHVPYDSNRRTLEEMESLQQAKEKRGSSSSRGQVFCPCCAGCCGTVILATWAIGMYVIGQSNFEVYGTKFTFLNYLVPQLSFLYAGQADSTSLRGWYDELTREDSLVGIGPGPNTRTYYGWQDVKDLLEDFGPRLRDGTMKRYNELGMQILSDSMWNETATTSIFGLSNSDHTVIRPYFGGILDGARGAFDQNCDGARCWNAAWLRRVFGERFGSLESFTAADISWIVAVVLHKVHLDLELSDSEAKHFVSFRNHFMSVIPVPFKRNWFWELTLGRFPVEAKAGYLRTYKAAIERKWPSEKWQDSPAKHAVLASAIMDSLVLMGGFWLPATLEILLALLFMDGEPGSSARPINMTDDAQLHDFVWETLRRFPPVAGVPRWITDDSGKTWKHQIPNVQQALQDPDKFPDPLEFRLGRPGLNHKDNSLSVGFADFAMLNDDVSDPNSHSCPGKHLSIQVMVAFLQEFAAAGPWEVDDPAISLNSFFSSGYVLRKSGGEQRG